MWVISSNSAPFTYSYVTSEKITRSRSLLSSVISKGRSWSSLWVGPGIVMMIRWTMLKICMYNFVCLASAIAQKTSIIGVRWGSTCLLSLLLLS